MKRGAVRLDKLPQVQQPKEPNKKHGEEEEIVMGQWSWKVLINMLEVISSKRCLLLQRGQKVLH